MLKQSKLIGETAKHYHIQLPSGHKMELKKDGLHEKAHKLIKSLKGEQKFEEGGFVGASEGLRTPEEVAADEAASQKWENIQQGRGYENLPPEMVYNKPETFVPVPEMVQKTSMPEQMAMREPGSVPSEIRSTEEQPQTGVPEQRFVPKLSPMQQAYQTEKQAALKMGDITAGEAAQESRAIAETQKQIQQLPTQQDVFNKYQAADQEYKQRLDSQRIDPDRYWSDKSTGAKIAAGIGMLLGGFGAVAGQPNLAVNMIDKAIERDIQAQRDDQSNTMNLWKMNRDKMGNDMAANLATQNQMYTVLKYKLEQAALGAKSQMAKQQALLTAAQIDQKMQENNFKMSLYNSGDGDPAMKVQFLVPPDRQPEAFKEIKRAQDTRAISDEILHAYDQTAKDVRPLSGGRLKNIFPGTESAYANKLESLLMTTVQDLEGTVKQTAMDNVKHNYMPHTGNSDLEIKERRRALEQYLNAKRSAPVAKGFGIDLDKHSSTAPIQTTPDIKTMNGIRYQKVPGGWKKVQ